MMKQDLLLQLEKIGYRVIERVFSNEEVYECEVPQEDGKLRIVTFGIKINKDGNINIRFRKCWITGEKISQLQKMILIELKQLLNF